MSLLNRSRFILRTLTRTVPLPKKPTSLRTLRIPIIPFAGLAYSTTAMAPVPAQQTQQEERKVGEVVVREPKSGGEKSGRMHSQVVIIGSGPAGHT